MFSGKPHGFLAFRVGGLIFFSSELSRLPDLVVEGVIAHGLSHDSRDYKRKLLIEMNDLGDDVKRALNARSSDVRTRRMVPDGSRRNPRPRPFQSV